MREDCTFAPRVEVLVELTRDEALLRVDVFTLSVVVPVRCVVVGEIVLTVVRVVPLLFTRVSTEVDGAVTLVVEEVRLVTFTEVDVVFVCVGRVDAEVLEDADVDDGRVVVVDEVLLFVVVCVIRDCVLVRSSPAFRIGVLDA